jgi:hypothetical protein
MTHDTTNAEQTDEYIKIWRDEGQLRAAFFSNEAILKEEIPVEDCNSDNVDELAVELNEAYPAHNVVFGYGTDDVSAEVADEVSQ